MRKLRRWAGGLVLALVLPPVLYLAAALVLSRIPVNADFRSAYRGVRIGVIRAVKGVIIGQLLISIVGFGALFELYSANFLMGHFWAVLIVLFALAFTISEFLAYLERRVGYYATKR